MAIHSLNLSQAEFQNAQQSRLATTENRVQEAALTETSSLAPAEISAHHQLYNRTVDDIDGVRNGRLGGLDRVGPGSFEKIFGEQVEEKKIDDATSPNILDNERAETIRKEYRQANAEAKRERARAARLYKKLGVGEHKLSNGDKVSITKHGKSGEVTVKTTQKNGTVKTVAFNPKNPHQVRIKKVLPDGSQETLEKNGTTITRNRRPVRDAISGGRPTPPEGSDGKSPHPVGPGRIGDQPPGAPKPGESSEALDDCAEDSEDEAGDADETGEGSTQERYSLDENGNPVKETRGSGKDEYRREVVNEDGSVDESELVDRDENNGPIYKDRHLPPGWELFRSPEDETKPQIRLHTPWWRESRPDAAWNRAELSSLRRRSA